MFGIQMTSSKQSTGTPMPFKTLRVWLFAIAAIGLSGYGISIMFEILRRVPVKAEFCCKRSLLTGQSLIVNQRI